MKLDAKWSGLLAVAVCALMLGGCATENDERDSMGSHLAQPPHGTKRPEPVAAGDIAIVGQDVAHEILQLPQIASSTTPPLVRFNGVTSIIQPPIDTAPYTELLRDRLLLLTREKLRFVEHTLPPYNGGKKKHVDNDVGDAEYQVLAEMRGQQKASTYKIQVEFVEIGSGNILFNQTYRISKEDEGQPSAGDYTPPMAPQPQGQQNPNLEPTTPERHDKGGVNENGDPNNPPPGYYDRPTTGSNYGGGVL